MDKHWKYSSKYWRHNTDIFKKGGIDFLKYKEGYANNFRLYYNVSRKEILHRKIYRDFINLILNEIVDGNVVSLEKGITFHVKEKKVYNNPYTDIYDRLTAGGMIPYIYMNTGEMITNNKTFLVVPSGLLRSRLLKLKTSGKKYTKIITKYYK